jgi:hypothetical protein
MELIPLSPFSPEFGRIEYELQLHLNAPSLQVTGCYDLTSEPGLSFPFTPANVVFAYIPTASLQQSISDISQRGISVDPEHGLRIRAGGFSAQCSEGVSEVVRVSVALGNPLNYRDLNASWTTEPPTVAHLLPGHQSLCVSPDGDFVIFRQTQIKPCHFVKFTTRPAFPAEVLCDLCNRAPATLWCVNDSAKLCRACDSDSHAANRMVAKHRRVPLTGAVALSEMCRLHTDRQAEYYCTQCQTPVCGECKRVGNHGNADCTEHALVSVTDAYSEALQVSQVGITRWCSESGQSMII